MSYAAQHASAHALIARKGAPCVFTVTTNWRDPSTGTTSPTTSTIPGVAIQVRGNPIKYQLLGLVESVAPTLDWCPDTYGVLPPLNATCVWAGKSFAAFDITPVGPDGVPILAKIVVKR